MIVLNVEPQWVSPYVFSCFVTLKEKGLSFDARVVDASRGETRTPEYLETTLTGRVPTLIHDGFGIGESSAIVEYLEERFTEPRVLPVDTRARARCRQIMSWLRSDDTASVRSERSADTIFFRRSLPPLSEEGVRGANKLVTLASRLLTDDSACLFGAWSIADAELAFMLQRLIANGDPVDGRVRAWATSQFERPSVVAFRSIERKTTG